jgi:CRP-like cAMP-binding protein
MPSHLFGLIGLCLTCPYKQHCFCKNLLNRSSTEIESSPIKNVALLAKQYLYRQGDMNEALFILREGWIMLTRHSEDGKRHVFRSILPGELIGFQNQLRGPTNYSAIALINSIVCRISNIVDLFSIRPELGLCLASALACDMKLTEMYLYNIAHRSAQERLAFMILELHHRLSLRGLNNGYSFKFPLNQDDIADTLGLTVVHINRSLQAFKEKGLLQINKRELIILNYTAISSLAGTDFKIFPPL